MAVCYRLYGLRNYIQTHDVVELENDISRGSGQYQLEIEIVKNITIDGKGHTINGDTGPHYQGRIFLVKENATLILKNLILIDSYCQSLGGVILCLGNIICYNCTFKNNIGEYDGGAICSQNGIEVYDSVFENNRLELSNNGGGALFAFKDIIYVNTIFINNNVGEKDGGAISSRMDVTLISCEFTNNRANARGGAVKARNVICYDSIFTHNWAGDSGGAIYTESTVKCDNCIFSNNIAMNSGGAIMSRSDLMVYNSVFENNKANKDWGGLLHSLANVKCVNSSFSGNHASTAVEQFMLMGIL